ncbi:MAG: hypothetical protein LLG00_12265 [Planctomycetaceae bacterium]|nr:hypothetical protein [Planctomycetaceae bacterium]
MRLITARPDLFARQGTVVSTWRKRGQKRFGPYYSLTYRIDGRQHSIYLGRAMELIQSVRRSLAAIRQPLQKIRFFDGLRRQILASLRIQKLSLKALLRPFGLRLKGLEVRGWRISPLRLLLPRCRRFMRRLSTRPHAPRGPQLSPAQRMERFLELRRKAAAS